MHLCLFLHGVSPLKLALTRLVLLLVQAKRDEDWLMSAKCPSAHCDFLHSLFLCALGGSCFSPKSPSFPCWSMKVFGGFRPPSDCSIFLTPLMKRVDCYSFLSYHDRSCSRKTEWGQQTCINCLDAGVYSWCWKWNLSRSYKGAGKTTKLP